MNGIDLAPRRYPANDVPESAPWGHMFAWGAGLWHWHLVVAGVGGAALCGQQPPGGRWRDYKTVLPRTEAACRACVRLHAEGKGTS